MSRRAQKDALQWDDCVEYLNEANVLDALVPMLKLNDADVEKKGTQDEDPYHEIVKMHAFLTVAFIMEEKDYDIIATDESMIAWVATMLLSAVESADNRYKGFSAEELVSGLRHIARNDKNKEAIVDHTLPLLTTLLKEGDEKEKSIVVQTIWELAFLKENRRKMLDSEDLIDALRDLKASNGQWQHAASGAIWVLEEEERLNTGGVERTIDESRLSRHSDVQDEAQEKHNLDGDIDGEARTKRSDTEKSASSAEHIMISYQWDHQNLAMRIKDELGNLGYRVWIDTESMGGSTLQAMADAVEKSAVVLICMSRRYIRSQNCRTEAEYAYQLQKNLIPIRVAPGYNPDGWLGALQGAKFYFDFSNLPEFETMMHKLTKEIGDRAKIVAYGPERSCIIAKQHSAHPARVLVKDWTPTEVNKWASDNNLHAKTLSSFDGRTLLFLKKLNCYAPEFYYRFVYDQLGVTALSSILNLNEALEALD